MNYTVTVNKLTQKEWESKSDRFEDKNLYQTWAYQNARVQGKNQELSYIEIADKKGHSCLMAIVRISKVPLFGLRVGYIQGGPLLRRKNHQPERDQELLALLRSRCLSGIVQILRMVPNLYTNEVPENYSETLVAAGFSPYKRIKPYHTILFPLDITEEEMRKRLHTKWRATLRRAERKRMETDESENVQQLFELEKMYLKSQTKKGFKGLDIGQFVQIQEKLLETQKLNMVLIKKRQEILSIDVNSYLGDTALGLFQATSEEGFSLGASYQAWWQTFVAARNAGMKRYDMGGIDPEKNPNVYKFKARMGGDEVFGIGVYDAYANVYAKWIGSLASYAYSKLKKSS
ncbi:lipid II:glycine glycyltransferase FemX [Planctomycetota bacterium]